MLSQTTCRDLLLFAFHARTPRPSTCPDRPKPKGLRADRFPNLLQLPFHRAVVNGAAHADDRPTQNRSVLIVFGANLLTGQRPHLRLDRAFFFIAELAGAG